MWIESGFLIQPEQYHIVGSHLLATLKELGGSEVTDEVLDAWGKAYGVLASIFIGRESEIYQEKASEIGGWQGPRPFIIKEKRVESELITSFVLAPLDGKPVLHFKPGQYLSIKLVHPELEYQEIRQYSLSDAPNGQHYRISVHGLEGSQIAAATEEQSATVQETSRMVIQINDSAQQTADGAEQSAIRSHELSDMAKVQRELLHHFSV